MVGASNVITSGDFEFALEDFLSLLLLNEFDAELSLLVLESPERDY